MISPDQALQKVLESADPLAPRQVSVPNATGLRLAEHVHADRDYPPFHRAMMDGYAVGLLSDAVDTTARLVGRVAAGEVFATALGPGECVEIMTGAECPPGTQAIVPLEQAVCDDRWVRFPEAWQPFQHMALRGSECLQRSALLQPGDFMTPLRVAVLASVGRHNVRVVPAPTVGIITTGSELVADDRLPGSAQIRDSNGPMLASMATVRGITPARVLHAIDDCDAIVAALGAVEDCDIVVLTGGVSTGRYDLVPDAIHRAGGQVVFHRVRQKPGKPLLFAKRGHQCLFGLPGNPLAAHLCFHRYVSAAIRRLGGHPVPDTNPMLGTLVDAIHANESRVWFVLGHADHGGSAEQPWSLQPLPGRSSADLFGVRCANCYIEVPPGSDVRQVGESVQFEWLAEAGG
jgi:molybdenum cofactor synthesis domain-containing protein